MDTLFQWAIISLQCTIMIDGIGEPVWVYQ